MRLINTKTHCLEEFFDHEIPFYAILSHRWEGSEVMFQDMSNGERSNMKDYSKMSGCCTQAQEDGLDYCWIDSCCIDKSSSAELSEAINSMFRWYQNAQVCYAYLSDVSTKQDSSGTYWKQQFCASKWFTRGWTLQELLAPEIVVFYDRQWMQFGTKSSLNVLISSVTKIDPEFITRSSKIQQASVAQKMSWASDRTTTRVEDIAYCLMGLLDVNMPLLYGEGSKAFFRLQLEIIKTSSDESIFAWGSWNVHTEKTAQSQSYGLLATSPSDFLGLGDIIDNDETQVASYVMTNRGLQLDSTRLSEVVNQDEGWSRLFKAIPSIWMLKLCCQRKRLGARDNAIAIFLTESPSNSGYWARISDTILAVKRKRHIAQNKTGYIHIAAKLDHLLARSNSEKQYHTLLIDTRLVKRTQYSITASINDGKRVVLERGSVFESSIVSPNQRADFVVSLSFNSTKGSFLLDAKHYPDGDFRLASSVKQSNSGKAALVHDEGLAWFGAVLGVCLKRKINNGQPVYVLELSI